jgi:hypothetical protein
MLPVKSPSLLASLERQCIHMSFAEKEPSPLIKTLSSSHFQKLPLLAITLLVLPACLLPAVAQAREISGKVVAVFTEPVTINQKVLDKVSVTVASCPTGKYETVVYSPGSVSEDNALGFLFEHSVQHGRAAVTKNQFMNMVNGHMTFTVPDNGTTVQKAVFWGANWECGVNVSGAPGAGASNGGMQPPASGNQSKPPAGGGGNPFMRGLPRF